MRGSDTKRKGEIRREKQHAARQKEGTRGERKNREELVEGENREVWERGRKRGLKTMEERKTDCDFGVK